MTGKRLKVAAVQMMSANAAADANLRRAEDLVDQAAGQGAQLILLPELFSTGFEFTEAAWDSAEAQGGPTESWLCATARRLGIHLGGSYMEALGEDFFNTFALATPEGAIAGRVRKCNPCSLEAYVFKGMAGPHVIPTALGRIGVAICYEGSLRAVYDDLLGGDTDLLLMPLSAPTPVKTAFYSEHKIEAFHATFRDGATQNAAWMGVPAVMANKWGPWESAIAGPWPAQVSRFPGFSHIADSDGRELARVGDGEDVIIAEVELAPERKARSFPAEAECWRPWIFDPPFEYRMFPWIEALGRRWYAGNRARPVLARTAAGRTGPRLEPQPFAPIALIDRILDGYRAELGGDFLAYRNHCQRVVHLCLAMAGTDASEKFAVAAAFHDLGIWTARSFDYLGPSRALVRRWLGESGRADWSGEIEEMIERHHSLISHPAGSLAETFRRADAVDVSLGLRRHGVSGKVLAGIRRRYPNAGFHVRLVHLALKRLTNPSARPAADDALVRPGGREKTTR